MWTKNLSGEKKHVSTHQLILSHQKGNELKRTHRHTETRPWPCSASVTLEPEGWGLFTYGSATANMIIGQISSVRCFGIWVHHIVLSKWDNWSPCSGGGVYSPRTIWQCGASRAVSRSLGARIHVYVTFFFPPSCLLTVESEVIPVQDMV